MHLYLLLKLLANEAALVDMHVMSPFSRNLQSSGSRPSRRAKTVYKVEHTLRSTLSCQLRDAAIASFNLLSFRLSIFGTIWLQRQIFNVNFG